METSEWLQWRLSGIFIVNFEHMSDLFLVFLLLTSNKQMLDGLGKVSLHNCIAAQLIRKYDVSYVKTTLLLCKYYVIYVN